MSIDTEVLKFWQVIFKDILRRSHGVTSLGSFQVYKLVCKLLSVICHTDRLGDKTHVTTRINAEMAFGKVPQPFRRSSLKKLEVEDQYLNLNKTSSKKLIANIMVNWKNEEYFF